MGCIVDVFGRVECIGARQGNSATSFVLAVFTHDE